MDIQSAALVGAGLAIGFGTLGPGIGIGLAVSAMLDGSARQPEMGPKLLTNMFIGAALVEVLALLAFVISFMLFNFGTAKPEAHAAMTAPAAQIEIVQNA